MLTHCCVLLCNDASIPHHNTLLVLEAAQGYRLAVLVVELEVRRRLPDRHHPQSRRADTLKACTSGAGEVHIKHKTSELQMHPLYYIYRHAQHTHFLKTGVMAATAIIAGRSLSL